MKNQKKLFVSYFITMCALILTAISTAHAATFTVNTDIDQGDIVPGNGICAIVNGTCSLRAAIEEANAMPGSDYINFSNSFKAPNAPKTIFLSLGQLEIKSDMAINGPGARQLMIDANQKSRVFWVKAPPGTPQINVLIAYLTIQNGYQYVPAFVTHGAGIINWGNLILSSVTVRGNHAVGDNPQQSEQGGGIANFGFLNLESSTVNGNKAGIGGGIYNAGVLYAYNSTISDNYSLWGGAGIFHAGSNAWIRNTTIAYNFAETQPGGGIANFSHLPFHMANTIVANNFATSNVDLDGSFDSDGNNLVRTRGNSFGYVASDLPDGTNPKLGVLKDNGGQTLTRALLSDSPAINAGNDCIVAAPNCSGEFYYDQRGYGFPRKIGSSVDIGAFEFQTRGVIKVQIGGKVLKSNNHGVNKAKVTLIGREGELRSMLTDSSGYFRFDDVATDETYVIKTESRDYRYAPQNLFVTETRDDVNFFPIESGDEATLNPQ